jgi:hypothetical protein
LEETGGDSKRFHTSGHSCCILFFLVHGCTWPECWGPVFFLLILISFIDSILSGVSLPIFMGFHVILAS